ncbi:MAG TPA: alpha/beta hydrolase [Propionibacterium sp.]|nr:alpha/beta hydrolase [Propionibacterium sp.]
MSPLGAGRAPAEAERYRPLAIEVTGGTLRGGIWDPAADRPEQGTVLAIHGITATHLTWQWLARALPGWRIIAPDLRGRGRSNDLAGPYGLQAHAADLAIVLEKILDDAGDDRPIPVVGHSMGGFISLVLGGLRPALIDRLLLVDGGIPVQLPEATSPGDALTAVLAPTEQRLRMEFESLDAVDAFWRQHPGLGSEWGPDLAAYAAYDTTGEPPHLRPTAHYEAMAEDSRDIQLGDTLPQALEELRHPALLLRAERGLQNEPAAMFSAEWATQWAERLPQLTVRDIPNTNHFTIVMSEAGAASVAAALVQKPFTLAD